MKYMLIIVGTEGEEQGEMSPEDMQAAMDVWNDYNRRLVDAGAFVAGDGLQPSATATTVAHVEGGERVVTDGPFAETKEQVGGFYVLECENLDAALDWAKKVPVRAGSSVEVRPVMDFTGFGYDDPYEAVRGTSEARA
jgi:hypothetical protein